MHLPLFFDVPYTQVHYDNNVVIVGVLLSISILVPSVVNVSVPFTELHKYAYLHYRTGRQGVFT